MTCICTPRINGDSTRRSIVLLSRSLLSFQSQNSDARSCYVERQGLRTTRVDILASAARSRVSTFSARGGRCPGLEALNHRCLRVEPPVWTHGSFPSVVLSRLLMKRFEIEGNYNFPKPAGVCTTIDLGDAPCGWSQSPRPPTASLTRALPRSPWQCERTREGKKKKTEERPEKSACKRRTPVRQRGCGRRQ
ncbi:hypothetical protein BD413DRAFT_232068 [Trametes elegans]|nr:hypothetical protein BD413DRAFT_232068 [Trametes elegans]